MQICVLVKIATTKKKHPARFVQVDATSSQGRTAAVGALDIVFGQLATGLETAHKRAVEVLSVVCFLENLISILCTGSCGRCGRAAARKRVAAGTKRPARDACSVPGGAAAGPGPVPHWRTRHIGPNLSPRNGSGKNLSRSATTAAATGTGTIGTIKKKVTLDLSLEIYFFLIINFMV